MTSLCCNVLETLKGKTLATAESCTGGGIGAALTSVPGSSEVFKGGIICYTNWVKENVLGVDREVLDKYGAVSWPVAGYMASGVRKLLKADVSVSVTGLAGPGGDVYGNGKFNDIDIIIWFKSGKQNHIFSKIDNFNRRTHIKNENLVRACILAFKCVFNNSYAVF